MRSKLIVLIIFAFFISTIAGCGSGEVLEQDFKFNTTEVTKPTVVIGRVPSETVIQLLQELEPLIEIIEKKTEVNVQFKFANNYDEIINGMQNNKYDLAFLGPLAYVQYENSSETISYQPLIKPVRYGNPYYRAIIFTYKNSGIKTLKQLEGRKIAFVDQTSTSGYLFPLAKLLESGIDPQKDMEKIDFLFRHDRVVRAVLEKKYEAGAVYKGARAQTLSKGQDPDELLPVLAETDKIPSEPLVIKKSFLKKNSELANSILNVLLELDNSPKGKSILNNLGIDRYIPAKNEDYDPVRRVIKTLGKKS